MDNDHGKNASYVYNIEYISAKQIQETLKSMDKGMIHLLGVGGGGHTNQLAFINLMNT